ncbi:MAG: plastocyanin/azurin family copper-binding protein [Pseudomonadota bacterium]
MTMLLRPLAVALLVSGLAAPASAQSNEPDCPEDFDTLPGCDMSPMDDPNWKPSTENRTAAEPAAAEEAAAEPEPTVAPADTAEADDAATEETAAHGHGSGDHGAAAAEEAAVAPEPAAEEQTEVVASAPAATGGKEHIIMARAVKFDPVFVFVEPGDTIAWENMASHNIRTIDQMVPEGQEMIKTELGVNYFTTFDTVGIVVYKCEPHWGARMGGIIVVGNPENPEEIIDAYMASTEVHKENLPARGLLKKLKEEMQKKGMI